MNKVNPTSSAGKMIRLKNAAFLRLFIFPAFAFPMAVFLAAPTCRAAAPCCGIVRINLKTGEVGGKEFATGRTFTFRVANRSLLTSLKIGEGVYANFRTRQVSIDGKTACCVIVQISDPSTSSPHSPGDKTATLAQGLAQRGAEQKAELEVLKERARSLAGQLGAVTLASTNANRAQVDLSKAWTNLLGDFDQWAHKFFVEVQNKTLPASVAGPGGEPVTHHYPLVTEGPPGIPGFLCLQGSSPSPGAFDYRCYKE